MPRRKIGDRAIHKTDEECPACRGKLETLDEWADYGYATDPTWYTIEERCAKCGWHYTVK